MKYLFIAFFILINVNLFAQKRDTITPGKLFIEANKLHTQSAIFGFASAASFTGAALLQAYGGTYIQENSVYRVGYIIGGLTAFGGIVTHFQAWNRIGQAGKLMNAKGVTFNGTKEGIGIAYKF